MDTDEALSADADEADGPAEGVACDAAPEAQLRVGEWLFYGTMSSLGDGAGSLANSCVRLGRASRGKGRETELVALKSVSLSGCQESVAMMRRECAILQELGDSHPHILPMLHWAELPSTKELVLLTPFASRGDLQKLHVSGTCIAESEVCRLSEQVLSGLAHLHERAIVHGDVKPQNVFLSPVQDALVAKLADFGLATRLPEKGASVRVGRVQGSHGYIAAEVIACGEVSCAIDLFAWGVVAFRLLSSYEPFYPASAVTSPLEFEAACWDPISAEARLFATRLLSVDPAIRGRAEDWLADPEGWLAGAAAGASTPAVAAPRSAWAPRLLEGVHFLELRAARALWERSRRGGGPLPERLPMSPASCSTASSGSGAFGGSAWTEGSAWAEEYTLPCSATGGAVASSAARRPAGGGPEGAAEVARGRARSEGEGLGRRAGSSWALQ